MKNIESFYPLSPMQQGMLFHALYAPEKGVYFEQFACTLRGPLKVSAFEKAWQQEVDRHSVLRTAFVAPGTKEPVQIVYRNIKISCPVLEWKETDSSLHSARLETLMQEERQQGFDLSSPPLMRLKLIRVGADRHFFLWSYHHLLMDGWSVALVLREVMYFYEMRNRGVEAYLPESRSYRDYIVWLNSQDASKAEHFWKRYLEGFSEPTPLLSGRWSLRNEENDPEEPPEIEISFSHKTTKRIQSYARSNGLTLNTCVQGAWALLMSRYSGEDDVVFGMTVSGRPPELEGAESMVGLFINTLPMRVKLPSQKSSVEWLKAIQTQSAEIRQFEYSPLSQVHGWSNVPRAIPLFESILVFENFPLPDSSGNAEGDLTILDVHSFSQTNYPLAIIGGLADQLILKLNFDRNKADACTARRILENLGALLEALVDSPNIDPNTLAIPNRTERAQLTREFNETYVGVPSNQTVVEIFEAQTLRASHTTALSGMAGSWVKREKLELSYGELNRRANQVGRYLQKIGVGPDRVVGICTERTIEMVVGMLGILKAGGAYLPLDPTYPLDRLASMIEDSGVRVILTQENLQDRLPDSLHAPCALRLDADWEEIAREPDDRPQSSAGPDNLAYVIYTSGSTGKPKGTMVQHRGVCNLIYALIDLFEMGPGSRVLQFASFGFDASVTEIFPTLAVGGTVCLAPQEVLASGGELLDLLRDEDISIVTLPPSLLDVLPAAELPMLKTLISAGEACSWEIVSRWALGRRFLNGYGPTETTVAASYYRVKRDECGEMSNVPIGRPIANTQIYVLDGNLRPVPMGVYGELCVGGVGLARGYLGRPELTAERFIPDLFGGDGGGRLYKTGDLVRYLPDGNIEFLGRMDHQVKVRGFRVELGEIEAALKRHPAVRQAAVVPWGETERNKRLAAYVVLKQNSPEPLPNEWRDFLRKRLPNYMAPSTFFTLDALPFNSSGKLDRRALESQGAKNAHRPQGHINPRDTLEAQLARIWEEVLDVQPIGMRDDFFDLGGHSVLAIRLTGQIKERLNKDVSLVFLYQNPTIESLARLLRSEEQGGMPSALVPLQPRGKTPPLFFVHPSGGSVHWYTELARLMGPRLGPKQPFYGLRADGLDGERAIHTRIEDMATHYVKTIRNFKPEGPYHLGSWSMGVVIAFEMARQLREQRQQVGLLVMLDQGPYLPAEEPEDDASYLMEVFGKHLPLTLDHLRKLEPDEQIAHVWQEAIKAEWIYPQIKVDQFRRFVNLLRTHTEAWRRYRPKIYPGRITLFRANGQAADHPEGADLGWGRLASTGVEIHDTPGDHLTMLQKPNVKTLAEKLRACLNELNEVEMTGKEK